MAASNDYLQYILEQLAGLGGVTSRRMFGAFGLYHEEQFFALIDSDTLYFKVGDSNREDYESRGMNRFRPYKDKPDLSMSYYEVPADVLEDVEDLVVWARRSVDAALASARLKRPAKRARAKLAATRPKATRPESKRLKSKPRGNRSPRR
jgi:DNA transformation protein